MLILLLLPLKVFASGVSFFIVYPGGEGDAEAAKPYLTQLFDYLKEQTGIDVSGEYVNDTDDALELFNQNKINLAIISPEFFEKYQKQFGFKKELDTIPIYSVGPFEKYYIMAGKDTNIEDLIDKQAAISLHASKLYTSDFLSSKIFGDNEDIKKIAWSPKESADILATIKNIAKGEANTFVLLSGYEFSVVNGLKKSNKDFSQLRLVFSSKPLPSSSFVSVGSADSQSVTQIKRSLLTMSASLQGNMILKKLRLKGFTGN